VIRVPPKRVGASRKGERQRGKSDEIDAQAVARAVVKDGVERFPAAYLDERAMDIRLLFDHREDLVKERTRMENRLRWQLLVLCPELEASLPARALSDLRALERLDRQLRRLEPSVRLRVAREELAHIRTLTRQADELERELRAMIGAYRPRLLAEQGCGALTAALLIGRTAGAQRFRSDACFSRQSGTAPIPCSSGQRTQHRLDRGGDRQLNRALHTIAITRARWDPVTREYLAGKEADGKGRKGALRALKRHLARRIWHLLTEPPLAPAPPQSTAQELEPHAEHRIPPAPAARRRSSRRSAGPAPSMCLT
jgi:transposase